MSRLERCLSHDLSVVADLLSSRPLKARASFVREGSML
jgi:hypothetical protein